LKQTNSHSCIPIKTEENGFGAFPSYKYLSWERLKIINTKSKREGPGREAIEVGPELVRESRRDGISARGTREPV
jgi:hypothetical protein